MSRLLLTNMSIFVLAAVLAGCSSAAEEPDCVPDPNAKPIVIEKKYERVGLGKAGKEALKKHDWCRACVMSKMGFASCQKVYSDEPGERKDKNALKGKARDKACTDAGFKKGSCPDSAIISILCKGDPPPAGTKAPGDAVQDLFQSLNKPGAAKVDVKVQPRAEKKADSKDKPTAPIIE